MSKLRLILDWLLNKNVLMRWLDGYKMQIGGAFAGLALVIDGLAPFCPPEISVQLVIISGALKAIAGYFGVVGGVGKIIKTGA